jgi:hypothetical protein
MTARIVDLLWTASADELRNVLAASSLPNSEILRLLQRYGGVTPAARQEAQTDKDFARQIGIRL